MWYVRYPWRDLPSQTHLQEKTGNSGCKSQFRFRFVNTFLWRPRSNFCLEYITPENVLRFAAFVLVLHDVYFPVMFTFPVHQYSGIRTTSIYNVVHWPAERMRTGFKPRRIWDQIFATILEVFSSKNKIEAFYNEWVIWKKILKRLCLDKVSGGLNKCFITHSRLYVLVA